MEIYEKNIRDITLNDLENLVEDEIDENNFIEYKGKPDSNGEKNIFRKPFVGLQI